MFRAAIARRAVNVAVSVAFLVTSCGTAAPPDATSTADGAPKVLRVAMFAAGNTLPVQVALTHGIFERHGLRVQLTEGPDLPVFMAALAKDQYDIVMSNPSLVLIGADKGIDLQIVSGLQRSSRQRPNAVWISRDSGVDALAELRGQAIAVPSLTGIIADAVTYLLQEEGMSRDDVRFVQTPFPTMGDQLSAGNADAAVATIPFSSAIGARGFRLHDDVIVEAVRKASGGAVDVAITTVWTAARSFGTEDPDVVRAWRSSLREAIELLYRDETNARRMMQEWLGLPPQVVERAPLPDWGVDITAADLEPYVAISRAVGATDTEPDVDALVWREP